MNNLICKLTTDYYTVSEDLSYASPPPPFKYNTCMQAPLSFNRISIRNTTITSYDKSYGRWGVGSKILLLLLS